LARVVAFLVLAVLALGIGAYLLRGPLFGRMIADRIAKELGQALGGRFTIVRVEGSYLSDLAVVGLRTEEAPQGPLRRLDCGRLVVEYDLRRILKGDLGGISNVLASNLAVDVDTTRSGGAPGGGRIEIPRRLPRLEISGEVTVETAMGTVKAEDLLFNTVGVNRYGIRAGVLRVPERFGRAGPFAGTLQRTGPLAFALTSETPVAGIRPDRVAWDGALDAHLLVGGSPVEVRWTGAEASLRSDALDLTRLPAWVYPEGLDLPREAVVAVDARATSLAPLVVDVVASAPRVRWRDADVSNVRLEGRYQDGSIRIGRAHAEGHGVAVDATEVALDPSLPWVVGDVGQADITVADLRALVPHLDRALSLSVVARRAGTRGVSIERARVEGEGVLLEGRGEITLPPDPQRWKEAIVAATCTGSLRDFTSGDYGFGGEVRLSAEVGGTVAAPEGAVRLEGAGLTVEGRKVERVALAVRVTPAKLDVEDLRVEGEAGTLRARGAVDLGTRRVSGASYELDVADLRGFLRLFPGAPEIEGSISGRGNLAWDGEGLSGSAEVTGAGLALGGTEIGAVTAKVRAAGGEVRVEDAVAEGPWGKATATGFVRPTEGTGSVDTLEVVTSRFPVKLNRPFRIGWSDAEAHAGPLDFAILGGRVQGNAAIAEGGRLEAELHGEDLDLSRVDAGLDGRARADLVVAGDRYEVDVIAPSVAYAGHTAAVRLTGHSGLDGIVVERLLVDAGETLTVEGRATLPWRLDGTVLTRVDTIEPSLALEVRGRGLERGPLRVGDASASLRGNGTDLGADVQLRDVSLDGFPIRGDTLVKLEGRTGRLEASAVLERCDLGDAEARVTTDRGIDWTRPQEIRRALEGAALGGEIRLRVPDLATLRHLVPGLAALSGTADGVVRVGGTLGAPRLDGKLHVAGVEAKAEADVPRLTEGSGDVTFDGRTIRIESIQGQLGYAPIGASGTIDLSGTVPVLDLRITGENALLVAEHDLRVRADLDLGVQGPLDALRIAGRVGLADVLYTRPQRLLGGGGPSTASGGGPLFRIRKKPFGAATLDIQVVADETVRVRTPTLSGNISCDLRLRGTGEAPAPEGHVYFRDLLIEERPVAALKVDRGEIRFPPGEPFDPRIDVIAHTRLKGYDLEIVVDGRVEDAQLHIASRPALSQDDAILLLATGYTREELEGEGIERAAFGKLATFLGAHLMARFSGPRDPDERTFLERFKFTVGKDVSRSGEDTIEAEFEASNRLFLRVERDRFDEYNGGVVWRIRFR
jgi:hypothetical protein